MRNQNLHGRNKTNKKCSLRKDKRTPFECTATAGPRKQVVAKRGSEAGGVAEVDKTKDETFNTLTPPSLAPQLNPSREAAFRFGLHSFDDVGKGENG